MPLRAATETTATMPALVPAQTFVGARKSPLLTASTVIAKLAPGLTTNGRAVNARSASVTVRMG